MSREDAQMKLRLPAELKAKLEESASKNNRSMNAEVLHRLRISFKPEELFDTVEDPKSNWIVYGDSNSGYAGAAALLAVAKALDANKEMLDKIDSKIEVSITLEDPEAKKVNK